MHHWARERTLTFLTALFQLIRLKFMNSKNGYLWRHHFSNSKNREKQKFTSNIFPWLNDKVVKDTEDCPYF